MNKFEVGEVVRVLRGYNFEWADVFKINKKSIKVKLTQGWGAGKIVSISPEKVAKLDEMINIVEITNSKMTISKSYYIDRTKYGDTMSQAERIPYQFIKFTEEDEFGNLLKVGKSYSALDYQTQQSRNKELISAINRVLTKK